MAAEASLGSSSSTIYRACLSVLAEKELGGHVLDFGAGRGALAGELRRTGRFEKIMAIDLVDRPADLAAEIEWISQDLNDRLALSDDLFDVVVACEIIEHLENPRAVVRELYRVLKPEGTLVLTTPNNESWRSIISLIGRGHFVAFQPGSYPAHITALLRMDLERILREAGFGEPEIGFTNSGLVPRLTRWTWQQLSFGLLGGLRFSDNLVLSVRK